MSQNLVMSWRLAARIIRYISRQLHGTGKNKRKRYEEPEKIPESPPEIDTGGCCLYHRSSTKRQGEGGGLILVLGRAEMKDNIK